MKVMYTGTSDSRGYSKADFAKAKVDHAGVKFMQNEPTDVSDELGKALLEHDLFKGEGFKEVTEEEEAKSGEEAATDSIPEKTATPANKSK